MPQVARRQMVALEMKDLVWLPERYTKEIPEFQRDKDGR
jgi:hypothetical protein